MSTDDRILEAALRVFAQAGFRGATTRRIAEEAGVNEVTLFRRYGTKEQLLLEAMHRDATSNRGKELPERPIDPIAELTAWAQVHVRRLVEHRVLIRSSMSELASHPELCATAGRGPTRVGAELSAYLERVRAAGLASTDWDVPVATSLLMGALFGEAVGRDLMPELHPYAPEEAAARHVRLFARAIGVQETNR